MALNYGLAFSVEKRQNGGGNSQKALLDPLPPSIGLILRGGDESFQVVWRRDLEAGLERTESYCVEQEPIIDGLLRGVIGPVIMS